MLVFSQILKITNSIGLYFTLNNDTELEEFQPKIKIDFTTKVKYTSMFKGTKNDFFNQVVH
jgi:hypothetical protein